MNQEHNMFRDFAEIVSTHTGFSSSNIELVIIGVIVAYAVYYSIGHSNRKDDSAGRNESGRLKHASYHDHRYDDGAKTRAMLFVFLAPVVVFIVGYLSLGVIAAAPASILTAALLFNKKEALSGYIERSDKRYYMTDEQKVEDAKPLNWENLSKVERIGFVVVMLTAVTAVTITVVTRVP